MHMQLHVNRYACAYAYESNEYVHVIAQHQSIKREISASEAHVQPPISFHRQAYRRHPLELRQLCHQAWLLLLPSQVRRRRPLLRLRRRLPQNAASPLSEQPRNPSPWNAAVREGTGDQSRGNRSIFTSGMHKGKLVHHSPILIRRSVPRDWP